MPSLGYVKDRLRKVLKHTFQPEKVITETDLELRLASAIKHIDTLETISDEHLGVLMQLVSTMQMAEDESVRKLAEQIQPGLTGFQRSLVELKSLRPILQIDSYKGYDDAK